MTARLLLSFTVLPLLGLAQSDPPGRVARLNLANGAVSMQSQATGPDWVPAQINFPLTTGDQIWTDFDSRAELHIGTAAIRLRDQTSAAFTVLDDQTVQLQLLSGGLNIRVRNLYPDEVFEVDTPNAAVTIREPGDYRVDTDGQQTKVIVWGGGAEIFGDGRTLPLRGRDFATVTGYGQLSYTLLRAPAPDDFDRWSQDRDRSHQQPTESARYVSPDVIGAEDLDLYGTWSEVPDLGPVWSPRVDIGWVPYKTGRWVWIEPWGWTWIDDAPWGFAPFHYGRWAFVAGSWGWVPGPRAQRTVYSPALVAWVGGGGGGGLRVSAAAGLGLAWFALGPREVYVPAHRASADYVARVNITNTTLNRTVVNNVYNTTIVNRTVMNNNITYVNRNAPGAVVGMSHTDMAAGRRAIVVMAPAAVQQAAQVSTIAPVPERRPLMQATPRAGGGAVPRPPAAVEAPRRPEVMRNQAPAGSPPRPVFSSAIGAPVPTPSPSQETIRPIQRRESETVRPTPPLERPRQENPDRPMRRPDPPPVSVTPPPASRPELVNRPTPPPTPRPERPAAETVDRPAPRPERVDRPTPPPTPRPERPAAETVDRPAPRPERVDRPAPLPAERPVVRPERVERPAQPPPAERIERPVVPRVERPEVRPEPRRESPEAPKRDEKKDDKKDEKKKS